MPAAIFNGDAVKLLKNKLKFKDGTELTSTDAGNVVASSANITDNAIVRGDGGAKDIQSSSVTIDDSDVVSGVTQLNVDNIRLDGNIISITDTDGNITLTPNGTGKVIISSDLQVDGTTTTVNSATLDVTDSNITVNNTGNQASADSNDAGLTVEMSDATDAIIHYDSTAASFWKIGEVGASVEVADISTAQTITNKSIDSDNNTITNIVNADIKAAAAIAVDKLAAVTVSRALVSDGSGFVSAATTTATEIGYVNGVTSAIQTQLNSKLEASDITSKLEIDDIFNMQADDSTFTAIANSTTIVNTSSLAATITLPAPASTEFVRIKDNGNAEANNITINQAVSETIDGAASHVINSNYGSVTLASDGTNWYIL